ncbi:MAG: phosphoadenosine phosphosulfate reductase family protein [Candidatus Thermoplasmatota archaeon]|nr:phosphoadenosine phosphosulfate reductase family protein [Candidatus Thermoplasmatota archaeon]
MASVYHGRIDLKWCMSCGVPLIRGEVCPACKGRLEKVPITPPGDVQPAFPFDIDLIKRTIDEQWGPGTWSILHSMGGPVLINPCPAPDRLLEVIVDGEVIGSLKFDQGTGSYIFILREYGGRVLQEACFRPDKGWVEADGTAVPFLEDGKNLLSPGIIGVFNNVRSMDEVLVIDPDGAIIGCGSSRKDADDMVGTRGMGVKMRWCKRTSPKEEVIAPVSYYHEKVWDKVLDVNMSFLLDDVHRAVSFTRDVIAEKGPDFAVSFSGGKDSLATLLLVLDAGFDPPVMFVDTGLEFPETVDHVHDIIREFGLKLIEGSPETGFYEELPKFGPPGRDHRWCCKVCKLGPMSDLITQNFPDGVLTFIGQRRYESESRQSKGPVWNNPWVPGQVGASPIQNWNALQIWLYIFSKKVGFNPLYNRGFQRIGCWLCPSCDMAESRLIDGTGVDTGKWYGYLESQKERSDMPPEWVTYGFHRFKVLPPHMKRLARELGLELDDLILKRQEQSLVTMVKGSNSCVDGLSREGVLGSSVPWNRFRELSNLLGPIIEDPETGGLLIRPEGWGMKRDMLEVFPDGTLVVRGRDGPSIDRTSRKLVSVVLRAAGCTGCSICVGRCPESALSIEDGIVRLDEKKCIHCGKCLGPCPAENFTEDPFDI